MIAHQSPAISHVCYRTGDGFTVVDVWEHRASITAFGAVIGPALQGAGLDGKPAGCRAQSARTVA